MTAAALRLRRVAAHRREAAATAGALRAVADDFRRKAAAQPDPETARPFLDEAEMFEAAAQRQPGL